MTQKADLIHKMAEFFKSEKFCEKGEDARLELSPDDVRCMNEIIKACDDAIPRSTAITLVNDVQTNGGFSDYKYYEYLYDHLSTMPSVNPQEPKTGHWVDTEFMKLKECSICHVRWGIYSIEEFVYCPNCGAKMVEPQESEE